MDGRFVQFDKAFSKKFSDEFILNLTSLLGRVVEDKIGSQLEDIREKVMDMQEMYLEIKKDFEYLTTALERKVDKSHDRIKKNRGDVSVIKVKLNISATS